MNKEKTKLGFFSILADIFLKPDDADEKDIEEIYAVNQDIGEKEKKELEKSSERVKLLEKTITVEPKIKTSKKMSKNNIKTEKINVDNTQVKHNNMQQAIDEGREVGE